MGFYAPAQLLREAHRQGVAVRPVDICHSHWDCTLESGAAVPPGAAPAPAIRLGLRLVKGLSAAAARRLVAARREQPWQSLADLQARAAPDRRALRALAAADALAGLAGDRHQAAWQVARREPARPLLPVGNAEPSLPLLTAPTEGANIVADYASLGLTLRRHPLALLRARLAALGLLSAAAVAATAPGRLVHGAGLVINRQRPAAANQVTFVTLEDETGQLNLVVWQQVAARHRATLLGARLLGVSGRVQRTAGVTQLLATELTDYSDLLGALLVRARDFR